MECWKFDETFHTEIASFHIAESHQNNVRLYTAWNLGDKPVLKSKKDKHDFKIVYYKTYTLIICEYRPSLSHDC